MVQRLTETKHKIIVKERKVKKVITILLVSTAASWLSVFRVYYVLRRCASSDSEYMLRKKFIQLNKGTNKSP